MKRITSICLSLCLFTAPLTAWSQEGIAPSYITSMSPYEVRSLSGALAPPSGQLSMQDITPAPWLDEPGNGLCGPCSLSLVLGSWSGGFKGYGEIMYVTGGGHADSANNGLYAYDFSGTTKPNGWVVPLVISDTADAREESNLYADGKPTSIHGYDGLVFAHHNQKAYRFGGATYGQGWFGNGAHVFDPATQQWSNLRNIPSSMEAHTFYDPQTRKIFLFGDTGAASEESYFYRIDTNTWSGNKMGGPWSSYATCAFDWTRGKGLAISGGSQSPNYEFNIDFNAETVTRTIMGTATGDTEILDVPGISIIYDPVADIYWMFGGAKNAGYSGTSPGWTHIYQMNADGPPWVIQRHTLTGANISVVDQWGSYGRFIFMDKWRAIGLVASHTSPAYVIKLPGEVVQDTNPPSPPTNLNIN